MASDKVRWCIEFRDFALLEHNYPIRVQDGVYSVRNGNDRLVFEPTASQRGLKHGIGLYINGRLESDRKRFS